MHQTATKVMFPQDIPDFLEHELQGDVWNSEDLDLALQRLYDKGGGTFDFADIVHGPTDFGTRDQEFGFADPQKCTDKPYSYFTPAVSEKNVIGVVGQFLYRAEKHDKIASRAQLMINAAGHSQIDLPRKRPMRTWWLLASLQVDPGTRLTGSSTLRFALRRLSRGSRTFLLTRVFTSLRIERFE